MYITPWNVTKTRFNCNNMFTFISEIYICAHNIYRISHHYKVCVRHTYEYVLCARTFFLPKHNLSGRMQARFLRDNARARKNWKKKHALKISKHSSSSPLEVDMEIGEWTRDRCNLGLSCTHSRWRENSSTSPKEELSWWQEDRQTG